MCRHFVEVDSLEKRVGLASKIRLLKERQPIGLSSKETFYFSCFITTCDHHEFGAWFLLKKIVLMIYILKPHNISVVYGGATIPIKYNLLLKFYSVTVIHQ